MFSPSFSSNNEDTGVEMSQGLLDLESIESTTPSTAKSPIIQDLILMKHDKCSSPEDENLQTLMGSPISDKDDELENEIPEIMLSSEHLDVTPSSCVSENACCKIPDSVDSDPQTICAISNSNVENPGAVVSLSEVSTLIEQLMESEVLIKALRNEISGLTKYQIELQRDYDAVHEMLEERQNDLTRVTEQLLETEIFLNNLLLMIFFSVGEVLDSVSPALSSTPRKSLPNETVVTPFSCANLSDLTNDVLGWNSDLKATPYIKQEEKEVNEVVSKVDYLRLLDEMEELRQELDLLRQNAQLSQLSHRISISYGKRCLSRRRKATLKRPIRIELSSGITKSRFQEQPRSHLGSLKNEADPDVAWKDI
ncbi:unnamed protein product [Schistosoma mattheei]|uniref:Uncharacterized protein n=1 Tax=Schistosoma mattheei TaxID=31246 RepID=A0A3P8GNF8_9TREM|nr:unnamed protein product [Schistosoma mattheei]